MPVILSLLLLLLLSSCSARAISTDEPAMQALRDALAVAAWRRGGGGGFCSWRGVTCDAANRSVVALDLPRRGLRGDTAAVSALLSLARLDLSGNLLAGPVPPSLAALPLLESLDLSANSFSGPIPPALADLPSLGSLNLSDNLLAGEIPDALRKLESLQELRLSGNNLTGAIPRWLGDLPELRLFAAYENHLSGTIPPSFTKLEVLNLHSNQLVGPIPDGLFLTGKLQVLILTMNGLTGHIPASIGRCPALSNVRIGNNRLDGVIPPSIGNASSLTYFEADNNRLAGGIPPELALCANLTLLNLAANRLAGPVPDALGGLRNLQELIVSGNELTGGIPRSLFGCRSLSKLDLSSNAFTGSLPGNLCAASRLQFLLLDQNLIGGAIPPAVGDCARLLQLEMGSNELAGSIPPEIGRIRSLQITLNLSFNRLQGPLPRELGRLDKLVSFDVSSNELTGGIPSELRGMLSLIQVNFSNNRLTGPVPVFAPFQKSPNSSFSGNVGLCGDPLSSTCGAAYFGSEDESDHHKVSVRIILAVVGSGLAVFITVSVVVGLFMLREKHEMAAKGSSVGLDASATPPLVVAGNVFVESLKQAVDFESVMDATMKDSNKLSDGTFSTVYKAVLRSGLVVSVKKLKSVDQTVVHQRNKMIRELERMGNLHHNNLMRPIGYVIYEDVALLLHHDMPNGTLAQLLHGTARDDYEPDWLRRLSIAIGVAEGLAFLHHVALIHLDISSSNIFLDGHSNALIGEIEISRLLDPLKGTASISAVAGSFGYIPPEYAYTMQVTAPGNVYSFGVVLFEILTSRMPVEESFGEGLDLVKWVHGASIRSETPEQIMDSRLSTVSFAWRKQMLAVLKVALLCTDSTSAKRPKMKRVVEMLLEVKG